MFPVVPVLLSVTQKKELPPAEAAPLLVYFLSLVYHIHIFTIEKMLEHFPRFLIWVEKSHNAAKTRQEKKVSVRLTGKFVFVQQVRAEKKV